MAVEDLSFTVEKGQIYGFLGPNGAGKSTTMNIMTGYIAAGSGCVRINGFDILTEPEKAKKYAQVLLNQAKLIAGLPITDPSGYTDLLCSLWA